MQKTLIKWVPVGIAGCFAIGFLVNSQWILVVIVVAITLAWVRLMSFSTRKASNSVQPEIIEKSSADPDEVAVPLKSEQDLHLKKLSCEGDRLYINEKNYDGALIIYNRLLALNSDNANLWCRKAYTLHMLERYSEAVVSFDRALEIDPDIDKATFSPYPDAFVFLSPATQLWCTRGQTLSLLGRDEEAIPSFDRAIALRSDDSIAWEGRGTSLARLGKNEEAIACYDRSLEIDANNVNAWSNRASSLNNLGRCEEALTNCDRAIALKSDNYFTWVIRGCVLDKLERWEEALSSFDRALEINQDLPDAWYGRIDPLGHLNRLKEAAVSYDRGVEIDPDFWDYGIVFPKDL